MAGAPGTLHRVSVVKQLQTKNGFKLACSNFFPTRDEGDKHSLSLKNTGFKSQGGWNYTDIVGAGLGTLTPYRLKRGGHLRRRTWRT